MRLISKEKFRGLELTQEVALDSAVTAIVGRNGAGKTRLLQAISEAKIIAILDEAPIPSNLIKLIGSYGMKPNLVFGFDLLQSRIERENAKLMYGTYQKHFHSDPALTRQSLGMSVLERLNGRGFGNLSALPEVVSTLSKSLLKEANELDPKDVADHWVPHISSDFATVNVTEIMVTYCDRVEQNKYNGWKNDQYQEGLPFLTVDQFRVRLGPPP